jgi:hypothetical protein
VAGREFENRVNDAEPNLGLIRFGSLKSVEGLDHGPAIDI